MKRLVAAVGAMTLGACSVSIDGENYQNAGAELDLFAFFEGDVKGWGIVQGRDGNVLQRFEVQIDSSISNGTLTLDETFTYSLGEGPEKRIWTINQSSPDRYEGRAGDILNTAQGQSFGNALYWAYQMELPVNNSSYKVNFQDWMWAFDDRTIVNRSYIKKFGLVWAEVTLFMQKQS